MLWHQLGQWGKTYPFRGKDIGVMPSFTEVLREIPNHDLLIHIQDGQHKTYQVLFETLAKLPEHQRCWLTVYSNNDGIAWLCTITLGWSQTFVYYMEQVPPDYAGYIWTNRVNLVGNANQDFRW
ncbi:hypothetical protein [Corynebacterium freiburgense]|uniref:hypothetical protein n=1 Tax=Corynebacterium freiburgense TaxID=556548 RepID=UPI0004020D40|nr:hypothetical protein [Corynebacterium freiburgense]WJZ03259.1 hypothetical protein CFREI_09910 [Corynebacterium freiburgense]